ncbi:MAG: hypothetical protein KGM42_09820 [Hyphomicrobiales bacterium]|nr:hypothetical protein [Hyphomicrobiales bacterium]
MKRLAISAALVLCAGLCAASAEPAKRGRAKPKAKPAAAAAAPDCPRAAYHGDPVCGWDDGGNLPTPSVGAVPRAKNDDLRVNDEVSVGSADPKEMKKTPVDQYLNNPNPNPRKQDVSGGASVNYKF